MVQKLKLIKKMREEKLIYIKVESLLDTCFDNLLCCGKVMTAVNNMQYERKILQSKEMKCVDILSQFSCKYLLSILTEHSEECKILQHHEEKSGVKNFDQFLNSKCPLLTSDKQKMFFFIIFLSYETLDYYLCKLS